MRTKKKIQVLLDLVMTITLPTLMSYSLVGEETHEWLGIFMFALFIAHQFINAGWYKALFRGRYTVRRIMNTVIDALLFLDMIVLMVSGVIMSRYVFAVLSLKGGMAFARTAHLLASYWGFVLMSVHIGFHAGAMIATVRKAAGITKPRVWRKVCLRTLAVAISAYGIYAFIKHQLGMYMFLKIQFVFFDRLEP